MAKILLVEDDNNLREIYEARLQAEGYDIVSAQDGEDALVKAKQEKPDLVISDVMMPRISGFEMLDILRNTEGLKDAKVIMLTALGQAEDKTRADALGADRYLVKSQVTLEDIVRAADELLNGGQAPADTATTNTPAEPSAPAVATTPMPVQAPPQEQPVQAQTVPAQPSAAPAASTPAVAAASAPAIPIVPPPATTTPATQQPNTAASAPAQTVPSPTVDTPAEPVEKPSSEPATPVSTPATEPTAASQAAPVVAPTPAITSTPPQAADTTDPTATTASAAPAIAEPTTAATTEPAVPVVTQAVADTPATTPPSTKPAEAPVQAPSAPAAAATPPQAAEPVVAASTAARTASPEPVAAPVTPTTAENDDKLIADAVKQLTGDATEEPTEATPKISAVATPAEPVEKPSSEPATPVSTPALTAEPVVPPVSDGTEVMPDAIEPAAESAPEPKAPAATPPQAAEPVAQEAVRATAPAIDSAQSAADEQAIMQQQIDDFINQQGTASPSPTAGNDGQEQTTIPVDADNAPEPTSEPTPKPQIPAAGQPADRTPAAQTFQPTETQPQPQTTEPSDSSDDMDNVNIAHKKVIQPPVQPLNTQPDLSELLAKEGITNMDEHAATPAHADNAPFAPPHAPGHVIAPSGPQAPPAATPPSADDPNNIAL